MVGAPKNHRSHASGDNIPVSGAHLERCSSCRLNSLRQQTSENFHLCFYSCLTCRSGNDPPKSVEFRQSPAPSPELARPLCQAGFDVLAVVQPLPCRGFVAASHDRLREPPTCACWTPFFSAALRFWACVGLAASKFLVARRCSTGFLTDENKIGDLCSCTVGPFLLHFQMHFHLHPDRHPQFIFILSFPSLSLSLFIIKLFT